MSGDESVWRRCSQCKQPLRFKAGYFLCSVSTCSRKGTDFAFCSVNCWDAHVPVLRHRDAWAEEKTAPSAEEWKRQQESAARESSAPRSSSSGTASSSAPSPAPRRVIVGGDTEPPRSLANASDIPREILIVVSKLKNYVRLRSGMNTSDEVMETLSDRLRTICDKAIAHAREDGRKTVMSRDFRNIP